jgi:DNA-directed RNA polymerase subunit E'
VAISPSMFKPKADISQVVLEILREKYEDKFVENLGYVICVLNVKRSSHGIITPGNPKILSEVEAELLSWYPLDKEVVEAEVADVREFGAFLRIGRIEGLVHISQIIDDQISYDKKGFRIIAKKTKRILEKKSLVRARIISVSYSSPSPSFKLAFTMRQPFLGRIEWIKEDLEKLKK